MNTALLLITHGRLGHDMLDTVRSILGYCPLAAEAMSVSNSCEPDSMYLEAAALCDRLDPGGGVLVLTDLYGSTPSNIANRLAESHNVLVISGVSVPMLLRVLNYPDSTLGKLGEIAASGARNGVVITTRKQAS